MSELRIVAVNDKGYSYNYLSDEQRYALDALHRYGVLTTKEIYDILI